MVEQIVVEELVENSDPANVLLIGVMWWDVDRRIRRLREELRESAEG